MNWIKWIVAVALLGTAGNAAAEGIYGQNRGMGGFSSAAVMDQSAIEVNPAGMSQIPRYTVGTVYGHAGTGWTFGASIIDSKNAPFTMGADFRIQQPTGGSTADATAFGAHRGMDLHLSVAEFYEQKVHLGFGYHFKKVKTLAPRPVSSAACCVKKKNHNLQAGILAPIHEQYRMSIVLQDILWFTDNAPPARFVIGHAYAPHNAIVITQDTMMFSNAIKRWTLALGFEAIAKEQIGLRGGYKYEFLPDRGNRMEFSTGAGWFFPKGQIAYAFNTEPGDNFKHTVSLELMITPEEEKYEY